MKFSKSKVVLGPAHLPALENLPRRLFQNQAQLTIFEILFEFRFLEHGMHK
jgi:hypothetical protein